LRPEHSGSTLLGVNGKVQGSVRYPVSGEFSFGSVARFDNPSNPAYSIFLAVEMVGGTTTTGGVKIAIGDKDATGSELQWKTLI